MAFLQNNYGYDTTYDDEEERKRREAAAMADEAVASGGGVRGPVSYGDIFGEYVDKRLGQAQDRINSAGQMFIDPKAALQQRLGMEQKQAMQEEAANTEVQSKTVKTYGDGSQEEVVKKQIPAGEPTAPQAVAPVMPTAQPAMAPAPQPTPQPQATAQPTPVAPSQLQQRPPMPGSLPAQGPISANQPMPNIGQPPTPGPATNFAGPATAGAMNRPPVVANQPPSAVAAAPGASLAQMGQAYTPTVERETEQPITQDDLHRQIIVSAKNEQDPTKRRQQFARLLADDSVSEGTKALANKFIADDYFKQRNMDIAERKIQEATPTDLARYMKEQSKEGSYVKAILLARLGLTDLAQKEQERIDPTITMGSAVDSEGNKYTVGRDKYGNITSGFDVNGRQIGQETLANLSAAALPTKAHLMAGVHGGLMQKTIVGPDGKQQIITGVVKSDPQTNTTYFEAGNKRYDTSGLSTPAQNTVNVFGAAQAGEAGKAAGQGFTPQPLKAFPGASGSAADIANSLNIPILSGTRDNEKQWQLYDNWIAGGKQGNPVARPGTSKHEVGQAIDVDSKKLTDAQRTQLANNGFFQPLPKTDPNHWELNASKAVEGSPVYKQKMAAELAETQAKANIELNKEVSAAEQKVPAAERGKQQARDVAKQGFADSTYPLLSAVREEISKSTGGKIGASVDELARVIGASTKGAEAIAKLDVLSGPIKMNIPRFEGAQSDADVREYSRQAGDFANPKLPIKTRLAALDAMETLLKKYDKANNNDWTFGRTQPEAGTTTSGNKYKRVQ